MTRCAFLRVYLKNNTAKNAASCNKPVDNQPIYQDAFAWLAAACWQQVCFKLSTDFWCKLSRYPTGLSQVVATSLRMTSCNKPDFNKLLLQLVNKLQQVGKIDNLQQVVVAGLLQAMRTHLDIDLLSTDLLQLARFWLCKRGNNTVVTGIVRYTRKNAQLVNKFVAMLLFC